MKSMTALMDEWAEEYGWMWTQRGLTPSARGYAYIVFERRLGKRKSLSYDVLIGSLHNRQNRATIRAQVDTILERNHESQG